MSKKNTKTRSKGNMYPLPERTVIYNRKKHLQPIPQVGERYHCFDDGKVRISRHFIIQVDEVLGHMAFKKKYPEQFELFMRRTKQSYWLFSRHTDFFVITHHGENNELGVYVRTKQGGWFGIGPYWNSATLDVTGQLWQYLLDNMDNFDYTDEEKKKFIEENTIN